MVTEQELGMMKEKLDNIERILMGNGTKGLLRKVDEVMGYMLKSDTRYQIEGQVEKWSRKKLLFYGSMAMGLLNILTYIIVDYIRHNII